VPVTRSLNIYLFYIMYILWVSLNGNVAPVTCSIIHGKGKDKGHPETGNEKPKKGRGIAYYFLNLGARYG